MINVNHAREYSRNYKAIENYKEALLDVDKKWDCHHRLETHDSDGNPRLVKLSKSELKALGMYYDRPAEELIFLTRKDHTALHKPNKAYKFTDAQRAHLSEVHKRIIRTPEWNKNNSESCKKSWEMYVTTADGTFLVDELYMYYSNISRRHVRDLRAQIRKHGYFYSNKQKIPVVSFTCNR